MHAQEHQGVRGNKYLSFNLSDHMPIAKVIRGHRMATVSAYISAGIDVIDLTCTDTLLGRGKEML